MSRYRSDIYPVWLNTKAMMVYVVALVGIGVMYSRYFMPFYYVLSGIVSVSVFFFWGEKVSNQWCIERVKPLSFEKKLFWAAFGIRSAWMLLIYAINMYYYGDAFGFENMDANYYHESGLYVADMIRSWNFQFYDGLKSITGGSVAFSDIGDSIFNGFIYAISGNSIIFARIVKVALSSYTAVLIYRLGRRNFDERIGRMAGILCMLLPQFWYYSGCHLKETEMTFLCVLFVEQADQMLRSGKFTLWKLFPLLLMVFAMFTFRDAVAILMVLSLLFTVVMASNRVMGWGKRIIIGLLALGLVGTMMGDRISQEANQLIHKVQSDDQKRNMEWRAVRADAEGHQNQFAKYAGAAIFAPLIFTIPFPTVVNFSDQDVQMLLNGANYIKNIMSGFVILAMFILLFSGIWRNHTLPLSFLLGYLVILVMSPFAQSGRFHIPALPFEMLFAAYGISVVNNSLKYKRWATYWMIIMFVAFIGWNWFKVKGRGMA